MDRSFYHFALNYRGKINPDEFSRFADAMFLDPSFPKTSNDFEKLSRYIEEKAHPIMKASTFDQMWDDYSSQ
ncbi:YozE family protein [Planomicrobium sp. CPCC 101079]|uniref:YozE family protein n=1 Tax=Planomicrobium sp. CPCC 101079 TaxID=2599618 RepID=UPI0011B4D48D|nr:YozE family protein [Planomicrobium sp. CPCC 101079]TWT00981.1 YozE family protein [Planomicrobium sp. CPCC 101079]